MVSAGRSIRYRSRAIRANSRLDRSTKRADARADAMRSVPNWVARMNNAQSAARTEVGVFRRGSAGPENVEMARYVELRRHTDADGDVLTQEGVRAATEIGARLRGGYDLLVSTGAQRATQTLACFLAARASGSREESSSRQVCAPAEKIAGVKRTSRQGA